MNKIIILLALLSVTGSAVAQSGEPHIEQFGIDKIISSYANNSGEKVLVDPRVKAKVKLHGQALEKLSYDNLTTILNTHAFGSFRSGGYLIIVPVNIMKNQPVGLVKQGQQYVANEMVNDLIEMEKLCPVDLLPLLRPILPPTSHLALLQEPRVLHLTATYANIQRIREIVDRLDSQLTKKQSCPE